MSMEARYQVTKQFKMRKRNVYILSLDEPLDILSSFTDVVVEIDGREYVATYYICPDPKLVIISQNGVPKRGIVRLLDIMYEYYPGDDF